MDHEPLIRGLIKGYADKKLTRLSRRIAPTFRPVRKPLDFARLCPNKPCAGWPWWAWTREPRRRTWRAPDASWPRSAAPWMTTTWNAARSASENSAQRLSLLSKTSAHSEG